MSDEREWAPHIEHALLRAPFFRGRNTTLATLGEWLAVPTAPWVCALVAVGGAGKTAIAEQLLSSMVPTGPVFVWSFYDNPSTDAFLTAAFLYLGVTGETREGRLGLLKASIRARRGCVFVLDGLEAVQNSDGRCESHQLATLLRSAASGYLGGVRFLLTSRFPISDLADWDGTGARTIELDDLSEDEAIGLLRARGLSAGADLQGAIRHTGTHALTLTVLAAWALLGSDGDLPSELYEIDVSDPSTRLSGLIDRLRAVMSPEERAAMGLLSLFPHGVDGDLIRALVRQVPMLAPVFDPADPVAFACLARLEELGLVFFCAGGRRYTAHPFLRDHFSRDLPRSPSDMHSDVADALDLRARPGLTDVDTLERLGRLLFHTAAAGRHRDAREIYFHRMGGYSNLALTHGLYELGLQSVALISEGGAPETCRSFPVLNDWALFAQDRGDLELAAACRDQIRHLVLRDAGYQRLRALGFEAMSSREQQALLGGLFHRSPRIGRRLALLLNCVPLEHDDVSEHHRGMAQELDGESFGWSKLSDEQVAKLALNRGHLEVLRGRLASANAAGELAHLLHPTAGSWALLALVEHRMGQPTSAAEGFRHAYAEGGRPLQSILGLWLIRCLVDRGELSTAESLISSALGIAEREGWVEIAGFLALEQCRVSLEQVRLSEAASTLQRARGYFDRSGQGEGMVLGHWLEGRLLLGRARLEEAQMELSEALQLARVHGMQGYAAAVGVSLAGVQLGLLDRTTSAATARVALASALETGDAWTEALARQVLGEATNDRAERDRGRAAWRRLRS